MHSWKKMALVAELEQHLPNYQIDCVLVNAWTATIFITSKNDGSLFCTTGIDIAALGDSASISKIAEELSFEAAIFRGG